jgi:lysophospholipase L1-like esterase
VAEHRLSTPEAVTSNGGGESVAEAGASSGDREMTLSETSAASAAAGDQINRPGRQRLALIIGGSLICLLVIECGARLWVSGRWIPDTVSMLTSHTDTRGRFMSDAMFGYRLTPNFRDPTGNFSHNSYGFRGPEFPLVKPRGGLRVVLLGASTVYGIFVKDRQTTAAQLELRLRNLLPGRPVEVLNAGVPGWTSLQTVRNLEQRVLPLRPDIVVIMDGRNEVFPQLFNHYQGDYSHYLIAGFNVRNSNYWHKELFRMSTMAMVLATMGNGHFGFSWREENPAYGSVNVTNTPTVKELRENAQDLRRLDGYRGHLQQAIHASHAQGVPVILTTMPFLAAKYFSGILPRDPETLPTIAAQVARNNEIVRAVAREPGVAVAEAAALTSQPSLFVDDCHFRANGEQALADILLESIKPLIGSGATG